MPFPGTPQQVRAFLDSIPDYRADSVVEYQIVLTKDDRDDLDSMDRLVVRAFAEGRSRGEIDREIRDAVVRATMVTPAVEFVEDTSAIFDPLVEFKARRVVDERPKE